MINLELLAQNPAKALKELTKSFAPKEKLWPFVKDIAQKYKVVLSCTPHFKKDIQRWKDVAKLMGSKVEYAEESDGNMGDLAYVSQFINCPHFRTAYIRRKPNGGETLVLGCLVNKQKFPQNELPGWGKMLKQYNDRIEKIYGEGREVTHIREWMNKVK